MLSWQVVGTELSALGALALSWPLRFLARPPRFDPTAPHPTPVVLVHGFLGDPTNLLVLRAHLAASGIRNGDVFTYGPRLDYDTLAERLGDAIDRLRDRTGVAAVDVVGHSLGGLIGRRLVERGEAGRVRRLVTLGSPYFARPLPANELAVFASSDPFVPAPFTTSAPARIMVLPDCGHWGLLYHPTALDQVVGFLRAGDVPAVRAPIPIGPRRLRAAS